MDPIDAFREPQRHLPFLEVPASDPRPRTVELCTLDAEIVGAGQVMDLDTFWSLTSTTAMVVVVDDVVVFERYADGVAATDRLLGNSATKSVLALLTGVAWADGSLGELDTPVIEHVPELSGSGYDRVTVRQVLTMTSGVAWREDYHDPDSVASRFVRRWRDGAGGTRDHLAAIGTEVAPGSRYMYCSPDSMVLDWVRERASGQPFATALSQLWQRIGAEHAAVVGLDAPADAGGVALAAAYVGLTARDWSRIGTAQIDGRIDGIDIVPSAWVDASSRCEESFLRPGRLPSTITTHAGFGYHWWPLDPDGECVMADGMRGQFVYVDRPRRVVVVKTSAWPYEDPWWDRQCRDLSYLALPAIAKATDTASRATMSL
jgi:CubicO group peptidase (beta-lactamase class C family)